LTDASTDGWANILSRGATFTWEVWQPSDLIGDSMSHGWGANVLVEIQRSLLGVTPDGAGFASFTVTPPSGALQRASGTVPTPAGKIALSWQRASTNASFFLDLTVPANTAATVRIPAARASDITESGHPLAQAAGVTVVSVAGGVATLRVGAGSYRFAVVA
jgi:alpha-L-rhamnosidase